MAAADTTTADSISGLGETLQNLISINVAGFAGIETSIKRTNSLLENSLGKNLQRIADVIAGANDEVLKQMQADARAAADDAPDAEDSS